MAKEQLDVNICVTFLLQFCGPLPLLWLSLLVSRLSCDFKLFVEESLFSMSVDTVNITFMASKYFMNISVLGFRCYLHFMNESEMACLRCMSVAELEIDTSCSQVLAVL